MASCGALMSAILSNTQRFYEICWFERCNICEFEFETMHQFLAQNGKKRYKELRMIFQIAFSQQLNYETFEKERFWNTLAISSIISKPLEESFFVLLIDHPNLPSLIVAAKNLLFKLLVPMPMLNTVSFWSAVFLGLDKKNIFKEGLGY